VVLLCNSTIDEQVATLEAIIRAVEAGLLKQERIDDALGRQRKIKERFLAKRPAAPVALDVVGCAAHQAVALEMAAWR
jgi:hypothetical protein